MKTTFAALALCLTAFCTRTVAESSTPTPARGCVVFQRPSQAMASMNEYLKVQDLGTNIAVTGLDGRLLTLFNHQGPIFIPYPTDSSATREKAMAQIERARKTYPAFGERFAAIEKTWAAAAAREKLAAPPSVAASPSPQKAKGVEIVTNSGTKYENVTIARVEPDGLSIMHDNGAAKVPFTDLSPELQVKYGYDPQKATEFTAATQEAVKQKAAAMEKAAAEQQKQADELRRTKRFDVQVADVKSKGAIVSPLTSIEEIPSPIFVEGLIGVAQGEKYEISAFRKGTYSDPDWKALQRWMCKSVSKDLRLLKEQQGDPYRPPSTSSERIGGG